MSRARKILLLLLVSLLAFAGFCKADDAPASLRFASRLIGRAVSRDAKRSAFLGAISEREMIATLFGKVEEAPAIRPAPATRPVNSGFADQGSFNFYVNEDRVGVMEGALQPNGAMDNKITLTVGGLSLHLATKITADDKGEWQKVESQTPVGPMTMERAGNQIRVTAKGKTQTAELKPGAILFDNYSPMLMSFAVRAYDRAKGGKQEFPLLIIPGAMLKASLEFKGTIEKSISGKDLKLDKFDYELPGVTVVVLADETGKIYLGEVPSQHAAYVRQGYEALRIVETPDPLLSKPTFNVKIDRDVRIAMRDGTQLATDLYRPEGEGRFPIILSRTPYNKLLTEPQAQYYARRGYVFAAQDCRGRFASQGEWEPFVNEKADGYDTIEWLARQPWASGKVGMIGGSYVGWVQWWAASQRPPHLTTIIPNVAPPEPFYNIPYEHGVFFLYGAIWWADIVESTKSADLAGMAAAMSNIGDKKYNQLLRSLPVIDLDKKVLGRENRYWRQWIEHSTDDTYWRRADFYDELKDVEIPVFNQSGWFDGDGIGSKLNYQKMVALGHKNQKLVLGPWAHTDTDTRMTGEWDFGPNAIVDLQRQYLRWFDHWLKGIDNGVMREPLVNIFVMSSNRWLRGNTYPLEGTQFEKWYIGSAGHPNTSEGDGRLGTQTPAADGASDHYAYDPGDPTPHPDYYVSDEDKSAATRPASDPATTSSSAAEQKSADVEEKIRRAYHAKVTRERPDILVYTSAPLEKPLTFAGPVSAVLYASSSAKDTDWFVRLIEVNKDGQLWERGEGRLRASFRDSVRKPTPIKPGQIVEYHLDLWQTGVTIPPGNRLRVEICSAEFPFFSRNLNTGGHSETETTYVTARQTIYHDQQHPSHVLLPVIPQEVLEGQGK